MTDSSYMNRARRTAEWICRNQYVSDDRWQAVPREPFDMNEDMNYGRFVRNYSLARREIVHLSTNWISGMTIHGLLALHDYFGEETYLQAACRGASYLKALQVTMDANPQAQGAISERAVANRWCAPRDALSAAWGMLRLHRATADDEWLRRAELFAGWHQRNALIAGRYPRSYCFFDHAEPLTVEAARAAIDGPPDTVLNCQGGSGLFYFDLFELTGNAAYKETMERIVQFYHETFMTDAGELLIRYDPETGRAGDSDRHLAWSDMHKFNDDFGALAMLAAHTVAGDDVLLDKVVTYMDWVASRWHPDGGFGKYSLSVSSCVVALNALNTFLVAGEPRFLDLARTAMTHLETFVVDAPDDPLIHGGILGLEVASVAEDDDMISLRVTMYALYAYLLMGIVEGLESGALARADIPSPVVTNPMLIGLRTPPRAHGS
jgi:rhamnogalacturonyl hydrolase YesR